MPRSRFDELVSLAEENDGLVTADHARQAGFTDSVLARLAQRGRIERTSRGVYRIPYLTPGRFSQYREAVLWAKANRGPQQVAISHATALATLEISGANPSSIHITVPKTARLRRQKPKGVVVHREDLGPQDITAHEAIPLTTVSKTVADLLKAGERIDLVRQAISDARREGFIGDLEAKQLQRRVQEHLKTVRASQSQMSLRSRELQSEADRAARKETCSRGAGTGIDQERLRRWVSFLALCGVLERAIHEGILGAYYLKGGAAMELRFAQRALATKDLDLGIEGGRAIRLQTLTTVLQLAFDDFTFRVKPRTRNMEQADTIRVCSVSYPRLGNH